MKEPKMTENIPNKKEQLFDLWAPNYDWLFTSVFYQAIHVRLLEYINLPPQSHILDLGCGTGKLLNRLAANFSDLRGIGLDLSTQMIHIARMKNCHRPRLIYIKGNAVALTFADNEFDAVFNTLSFLHYPVPEQVFQEVSRVLNTQGRFYLVDITTWRKLDSEYEHRAFLPNNIRFYSPKAREELGREAGLNCLGHYYLLGPVLLTIFAK
ncbi:class I SAM-dependent methyltransferase [Aerosakkonema funiforme]|nr:class I SAM-dependent methyltransferase [Aerosakkonema funiforme]